MPNTDKMQTEYISQQKMYTTLLGPSLAASVLGSVAVCDQISSNDFGATNAKRMS